MSDLDNLDPDCKICLVSYLPMISFLEANIKQRKTFTNHNVEKGGHIKNQSMNMRGLTENEFAVKNWKDYYNLSLKRAEEGLNQTKETWFS